MNLFLIRETVLISFGTVFYSYDLGGLASHRHMPIQSIEKSVRKLIISQYLILIRIS